MQSLYLCKAAVSLGQRRYWRPGLHDQVQLVHVPVIALPRTPNPRAFVANNNHVHTTTHVRWSTRLPTHPLVGQTVRTEDDSESNDGDTATQENVDDVGLEEVQTESDNGEDEGGCSSRPSKRRKTDSKKEPAPQLRAYHIRIRPDKHARAALRHMFAGVHATHNMTVEKLRKCESFASAYDIRNAVVPSDSLGNDKKWMSKIPTRPRANKVRQLVGAYNKDVKNKGRGAFQMKFSSWRTTVEHTMEFDKWTGGSKGVVNSFAEVDGFSGHSRKHAEMKLSVQSTLFSTGEHVPVESLKVPFCDKPWLVNHLLANGLEHAYRIKWHRRLNRWWLLVLVDNEKARAPSRSVVSSENTCCAKSHGDDGVGGQGGAVVDNALRNAVSLDPGVRTFQTTYDPSGRVHALCPGFTERIKHLCQRIDRRRSRLGRAINTHAEACAEEHKPVPHVNRKERQSRRNCIKRVRYNMHTTMQKVRNTVKWNHWQAVNFLFRHYDTVLIPVFQTQSMLPTLASKAARAMATLSHYSFRLRLLSRMEEEPNRQVVVTREPGTSRTCCLCGTWNANLGGATTLSCHGCGAQINRDVNGAVGNFLAYLTDGP